MEARAKAIFQDLVAANDSVDTSESSTIGRFIGWIAPSITELWEAAQDTNAIFDPNSSYGIGLDNLVAYGGLIREKASRTTFNAEVWGDVGVVIDAGKVVRNSITSSQYQTTTQTTLTTEGSAGIGLKAANAIPGDVYSLYMSGSNWWVNWTYTAQVGDTTLDIIENLEQYLNDNAAQNVKTRYDDSTEILYIDTVAQVSSFTKNPSSNLVVVKNKHLIQFQAIEFGPVEAQVGAVNAIVTPVLGWDSVVNNSVAFLGSDAETDEELRQRFRLSKALRAVSLTDSLYSALQEVPGVEQIRLYENTSNTVDSIGQPPHSFRPVVLGGLNQDVANAIWINRPMGIASTGNTSVPIVDSQSNVQQVNFTRPVEVPIYVNIKVTEIDEGMEEGGVEKIKQAVVDYINSTRKIGGEVVVSRLYTPVNTVKGHEIEELTIGKTLGSMGTSRIVFNYDEIALIGLENVAVEII